MSLYSFTYIQASLGRFDLALPSTSFPGQNDKRALTLCVFKFFIIVFIIIFFKTTSPHRNGPFIVIVQLQILECCLIHRIGFLESENRTWNGDDLHGTDGKFLNQMFWYFFLKMKKWQCIVERGIIWFDVSLWQKYETICQCVCWTGTNNISQKQRLKVMST